MLTKHWIFQSLRTINKIVKLWPELRAYSDRNSFVTLKTDAFENVLTVTSTQRNKIKSVYAVWYTGIPKVFTPHNVGPCCTNVVRGHYCVLGHSCTTATPDLCCVLGYSCTNAIKGHALQHCTPLTTIRRSSTNDSRYHWYTTKIIKMRQRDRQT
jgi:hypothetical protein